MRDHEGRVCLVVGGSSGIGRGASLALAAQGAMVAVHGRDDGEADEVVDLIAKTGGRAIALQGPIQDAATSEQAVAETIRVFGGLDSLVVSSGIQRYGDAVETTEEVWDEVFAVNARGPFLAAHAALPTLRTSPSGSIVFVASVQGAASQARVAAYAASKGALLALVRSMAVDEGPRGVRVNSVSPGSIDTPMLQASAARFSEGSDRTPRDLMDNWGTAHALGRLGESSEVGEAIAFLAGPRATFITGTDLKVDGGMLARLPAPLPFEPKAQ